jgi:hypothetical protein
MMGGQMSGQLRGRAEEEVGPWKDARKSRSQGTQPAGHLASRREAAKSLSSLAGQLVPKWPQKSVNRPLTRYHLNHEVVRRNEYNKSVSSNSFWYIFINQTQLPFPFINTSLRDGKSDSLLIT